MSCGAVAMAKMYAGSDAALTMGLIMGAHMVRLCKIICSSSRLPFPAVWPLRLRTLLTLSLLFLS